MQMRFDWFEQLDVSLARAGTFDFTINYHKLLSSMFAAFAWSSS